MIIKGRKYLVPPLPIMVSGQRSHCTKANIFHFYDHKKLRIYDHKKPRFYDHKMKNFHDHENVIRKFIQFIFL